MALDPPANSHELASLLDYKIEHDPGYVVLSREAAREIAKHLRSIEVAD